MKDVRIETASEPRGSIGICLSGGGLRAAAFGLGALQSLHEQLGLLRGDRSARWISAVSGGSYIAGALTLLNAGSHARYCDGTSVGGHDIPASDNPLRQGSPEVAHILRHCRYMVDDGGLRTVGRLLLLVLASFITLASEILWISVMVFGSGGFIGLLLHQWVPPPSLPVFSEWLIGLFGFLLLGLFIRVKHFLLRMICLIPVLALWGWSVPVLARRLEGTPLLRSPQWLMEQSVVILLTAAILLIVVIGLNIASHWKPLGVLAKVGRAMTLFIVAATPWLIAILLISWVGIFAFTNIAKTMIDPAASAITVGIAGLLFFVVLIMGVIIIPMPGLISPHRPYRELVSRCFAIRKAADGSAEAVARPDHVALSSLAPSEQGVRYPELIICAAANISDRGAAPAGSNVLPLTMSAEGLSIPTHPESLIRTSDLEGMISPPVGYGLVQPAPMLSLSAAVAITGAALSPSMGRMSQPSLRPLLAALNIRLGVWLPNPISQSARNFAKERRSRKFTVTIDQLMWEFFGYHSSKSPLLYASDGGHYENLGIVELLRRKCGTIYAVDASQDTPGRASTLVQSILLAEAEIGCEININVEAFAIRKGDRRPASTHASGTIQYPDGSSGVLHVLKLGVTDQHSSMLKEYEEQDADFPYHATIHQVYSAERFEAYRRLGAESADLMLI